MLGDRIMNLLGHADSIKKRVGDHLFDEYIKYSKGRKHGSMRQYRIFGETLEIPEAIFESTDLSEYIVGSYIYNLESLEPNKPCENVCDTGIISNIILDISALNSLLDMCKDMGLISKLEAYEVSSRLITLFAKVLHDMNQRSLDMCKKECRW